jgi:hypothetical protein
MMKKLAVLQSNYIPWKGYFDIIHEVDQFVFYDDVQFTKNDWRNRNKILTKQGVQWISVPVGSSENRLIAEVTMANTLWQRKHFDTLVCAYGRAPYFKQYRPFFEHVFLEREWGYLYELNRYLITEIAGRFLKVKTAFADSRDYPAEGKKKERLLNLIRACDADIYISGPAAKDYLSESDFAGEKASLVWKDYSGYPEYPHISAQFSHNVSIVDLLFHVGDEAPYYIWGHRDR